jgi:hypothetical protein
LLPGTFSFWWWGRHYGAADSTKAIVDGVSVLFDVIVTSQVERLAHALNISLRKERANVHLKARRFRHCASQVLELRSEIVARLAQTTQRHKAVTIQPEQNGPRNWTMVLPVLSYRLLCLYA